MFEFATQFKLRLGLAQFNFSTAVLRAQLGFLAGHALVDTMDEMPLAARVGAPVTISGVSWTGSLSSNDPTWTGIAPEVPVNTVALFQEAASDVDRLLLGFMRYPRLLTTGGDVRLQLPSGIWFVL